MKTQGFLLILLYKYYNHMADKKNETYTAQYTHYAHPEEVIDPVTGEVKMRLTEETVTRTVEVIPDYVDIKMPKKFKFNNGNFVTIFQKAILNIAMFSKLTKNEMQLLLYLIGSCGVGNSVCTDLDKLADALSMKKPNVSTALKGLVERNIVIRKDGYRYGKTPLPFELHLDFDQINYNLAYNGKIKSFKENKNNHPQLMKPDGETPLIPEKEPKYQDTVLEQLENLNQEQSSDMRKS